jgi:hypothetical protein
MPTIIYFGERLSITVSEEPDQVEEALYQANQADGRSFKLHELDGRELYVNPARIALWRGAGRERRPARPPGPPPSLPADLQLGSEPPAGHRVAGEGAPSPEGIHQPQRLALRYDRPDESTTEQIYRLERLLPEPLTIGSASAEYWVSYPDWFGEAKTREAVRRLIHSESLNLLDVDD